MDNSRVTRKVRVSYAESDDSDSHTSKDLTSVNDIYGDDGFEDEDDDDEDLDDSELRSGRGAMRFTDEADDDEDEASGSATTQTQDRSTRGYSLRTKPSVSLKGTESARTRVVVKPKANRVKSKSKRGSYRKKASRQASAKNKNAAKLTQRNLVRNHISSVTAAKRERFMIHHKDLFLPLLPERNYISKLVEHDSASSNQIAQIAQVVQGDQEMQDVQDVQDVQEMKDVEMEDVQDVKNVQDSRDAQEAQDVSNGLDKLDTHDEAFGVKAIAQDVHDVSNGFDKSNTDDEAFGVKAIAQDAQDIPDSLDEPNTDDEKFGVNAITPYEELLTQPKGIKATMKPYQLLGLSFMVYLHKNGLSGILGDEMGLGKTLQTISLIQWLKENDPTVGEMRCPTLVICPLSVLSSWMNELAKWAPGLKVIRFHGPIKERNRLKRVAVGDVDIHGNETAKHKSKVNARLTAKGKEVIDLDPELEEDSGDVDVVVTTYESYLAEQSWIKRAFVWRYVILDEGHKIKNDMSLVSKALQGLSAEYRLILTGTPLQNNLQELWALLHWLYPDVFNHNTSDLFSNSFDLGRGKYSDQTVDHSRRLLELIMLRRMKNSPGVNLNLPPKTEVLLFVPLAPMQRFWYKRLITRADSGLLEELFKGAKDKEATALQFEDDVQAKLIDQHAEALVNNDEELIGGSDEWKESEAILKRTIEREEDSKQDDASTKTSSWRNLMNLMMQLRKVSTHPYQIRHAEPDPYVTGEHLITASGKFIVLEKLVMELVVKNRKKILIFSGFTKVLDLVEEFLSLRGGDGKNFKTIRLDGNTGRARRNLGIRLFNNEDSEYKIMLISTRAGGLGINLATASDVILLDQDWNPQITLQAEARAHRIGQVNPVTVYKFVSQGTVEEQMMGRIQKKLYLSAKVTEAMEDIHTSAGRKSKGKGRAKKAEDDNVPNLSVGQLMSLVRRGTAAVSRPEIDVKEMLSWDWEKCLEVCKDKPLDIQVQKDAIPDAAVDKEAEAKWLSEMERVESTVFEGKQLQRGAKRFGPTNGDLKNEWEELDRAARRDGKNTTVMIDGYAVDKNTVGCADWEAVPTLAGKDPRLASPKREKRAKINNQSHCQICLDGGDLHLCQHCPRSYHLNCLEDEFKMKAKSTMFICPQHQCNECEQKTADAGGMLYRCRWCERAYCEDCLQWEKSKLLGENLLEYEVLDYSTTSQAFYIQCHQCTQSFDDFPQNKSLCEALEKEAALQHNRKFNTSPSSSRAASLTDATTIETNGVGTPIIIMDDDDDDVKEVAKPRHILKFTKRKSTTPGMEDSWTATSSSAPTLRHPVNGEMVNGGSKRKLHNGYSPDRSQPSGSDPKQSKLDAWDNFV